MHRSIKDDSNKIYFIILWRSAQPNWENGPRAGATRHGHHAAGEQVAVRWCAHRRRCGSGSVTRCGERAPVGAQGGAGQGGGRRDSLEMDDGGEAEKWSGAAVF
jgi:hypothetical protein